MINQAVPPGGDLCIALGQVEACDLPKRGRLGCEIFGSGGLRSRVPRSTKNKTILIHFMVACLCFNLNGKSDLAYVASTTGLVPKLFS